MKIENIAWSTLKLNSDICSQELLAQINAVYNENPSLKTYLAEYQYGDFIAKEGALKLPGSEKFAFGLVIKGGLEVFVQNKQSPQEDKVTTLAMLKPGNLLFLHEELEPSTVPLELQYVTAGARSIFFLAKLSNSDHFFKLSKRNNIPMYAPSSLFQQWEIFKTLAEAKQSNWSARVLLFTEEWLHQVKSPELKRFLLTQGAPTPDFQSHRHVIDSIVTGVVQRKNEMYAAHILKNVLSVVEGDLPGFSFAENETFAPTQLIRDTFKEDYGLELTELMQPGYIRPGADCFYSFVFNSSIDQYADHLHRKRQSSAALMREIQTLYLRLMEAGGWRRGDKYDLAKLEFLHTYAQEASAAHEESAVHSKQAPFLRQGCILITPR